MSDTRTNVRRSLRVAMWVLVIAVALAVLIYKWNADEPPVRHGQHPQSGRMGS